MPDEPEVETTELQEAIDEIHQDRKEREEEEQRNKWTKYVGLATAIFAVFAALGALESGSLVNEAMIQRLKASDAWNEYQADKNKVHVYQIPVNAMIDAGVNPDKPAKTKRMFPGQRLSSYLDQIEKENEKTGELSKEAKKLEGESEELLHKHHEFAFSVTAIQVAIALGAVSALTKIKWVWFVSLVFGVIGVALFLTGIL